MYKEYSKEHMDKALKKLGDIGLSPFGIGSKGDTKTDRELQEEILENLNRVERKLDLIFGNSYLINGRFLDIKQVLGE